MDDVRWQELIALRPDAPPGAAAWWVVDPADDGDPTVGSLLPPTFESYARIVHPAVGEFRELDTRVHGYLDREDLAIVLAAAGTPDDEVLVALRHGDHDVPESWTAERATPLGAASVHPFVRRLADVLDLCRDASAAHLAQQLEEQAGSEAPRDVVTEHLPHLHVHPHAVWAADHAWAMVTPEHLDSTLVGGPTALVETLVADPRLDARPVTAADRLPVVPLG